ncbi:SUMF1/EgtB/PvdO family nonheme iron enzyme [Myxacorys almedinensis]|uniref:Ergothioneine biosynthesis protein EgtB n=1 Tax=Myxacorys almedinensis A TaxID=2690445 RepID=A0A8J7Z8B6_9CYAN|nr:SUMF1/EgtB/PvdO family nonheme iron enzyme [Myxacorys almedinensis]NDJ17325.1 ergothioneine biosynthesis protein EgtB [Myxacorys almedinensis A]
MTLRSISSLSSASLIQTIQACRHATLALFEDVDYEIFCRQAHPDFSPIGWHLGHIAYTEALWILQRLAGYPPVFSEYHCLFAQDGLSKCDRVYLPPIAEVVDYLDTVRSKVLTYLDSAPFEHQERLWRWLLQHESQHAETIAMVLALTQATDKRSILITQTPDRAEGGSGDLSRAIAGEMVFVEAGYFEQGNDAVDAIDNERPIQSVYLEDYWIDRYPVTCRDYRFFIQAGGYDDPRWWSEEAWKWLQTSQTRHPLYWVDDPRNDDHPVCGVSWYEANAYAQFVEKRLPTEAEWEKAASWNPTLQERLLYPWGHEEPEQTRCNHQHLVGMTTPVDRYPQGQSAYGCFDMLGNVWEWTATWFGSYPGFKGFPYASYSQTYFDAAHRVLKGGSWATRRWAMRNAFRNWYHPHVQQVFAGFRCASHSHRF